MLAISIVIILLGSTCEALDNGLAKVPPMGWLAWERFTCQTNCLEYPDDCISAQLFKTMADRLVTDGYLEAGYKYVNIDDCWSEKERQNGSQRLVADTTRFPEGIKALSEYVHARGLELGIYGDCGTKTCAGYPAQLKTDTNLEDNFFEADATTFAEWQVDSFKFDGCFIEPDRAESICPRMAEALRRTERPILLVCEWPFYLLRLGKKPDFDLAQRSCNAWRYYEDVEDSWLSVLSIVDFTIKMQETIVEHHGPGHWFDPDQLVIGNFGLSLNQAKAQMAIWSIWSAPLYMSNDLRDIEPEMMEVLKNRRLIKVDQDELGVFGLMVNQTEDGSIQAFVKPIEPIRNGCPSFVIVYLNRNTLGNGKLVSLDLRGLLKKSAIEKAAQRYNQMYPTLKPGGGFLADYCRVRLTSGMTRSPGAPDLIVKPQGKEGVVPLEETSIVFNVFDLIEDERPRKVALDSKLDLYVEPSGVRAVELSENTIF